MVAGSAMWRRFLFVNTQVPAKLWQNNHTKRIYRDRHVLVVIKPWSLLTTDQISGGGCEHDFHHL